MIELSARPERDDIRLRILGDAPMDAAPLVRTARRWLDLDADPATIDAALSSDRALRPSVRATPGIRLPGTADGFELVVRAILGQQVSVRAARTFAGRIAEATGTPLARPVGDVTHLFPSAEQLAASQLGGLGLTTARTATLGRVAELVARASWICPGPRTERRPPSGSSPCGASGRGRSRTSRCARCGIADAFPVGDLGVRLGFEALGLASTPAAMLEHAERWRPWRAYAVMHLWNSLHG